MKLHYRIVKIIGDLLSFTNRRDGKFYICDGYFGGTGKTPCEINYDLVFYFNGEPDRLRKVHYDKGTHQPDFLVPAGAHRVIEFDVRFHEDAIYPYYNPEHDADWSKITGGQQNILWEHIGDSARISWRVVKRSDGYYLQIGHYTWIQSTSPQVTGYKGAISLIEPCRWYRFKIEADDDNFYYYFNKKLVHVQTRMLPD